MKEKSVDSIFENIPAKVLGASGLLISLVAILTFLIIGNFRLKTHDEGTVISVQRGKSGGHFNLCTDINVKPGWRIDSVMLGGAVITSGFKSVNQPVDRTRKKQSRLLLYDQPLARDSRLDTRFRVRVFYSRLLALNVLNYQKDDLSRVL